MRIAITGGTGFVGRHLADQLRRDGHEVLVVGRSTGTDVTDIAALTTAFAGCHAVAHCAGINREIGSQTYARVHVEGTRAVVEAAHAAGVARIAMLSFLRARPDGPTAYHRTNWEAEELIRASGLGWTVLKAGVIHGRGDHMLDHLSHALRTFPVFGLVGMQDRPVRPVAVADVVRVLAASVTGDPRLTERTVAVLGPEELSLGDAVRRVAAVVGRSPRYVRLPVRAQLLLAHVAELVMRVPLISIAQVHILAEGVTIPTPFAVTLPDDLQPGTPFSTDIIRRGLPPPGGFGPTDLRACRRSTSTAPRP